MAIIKKKPTKKQATKKPVQVEKVETCVVEEVQPEAVDLAPFDNDGEDKSISGDNYLTVKYDKLVPLLIESIKELKAEIEELKK